jgi:hypothetical protein
MVSERGLAHRPPFAILDGANRTRSERLWKMSLIFPLSPSEIG